MERPEIEEKKMADISQKGAVSHATLLSLQVSVQTLNVQLVYPNVPAGLLAVIAGQ